MKSPNAKYIAKSREKAAADNWIRKEYKIMVNWDVLIKRLIARQKKRLITQQKKREQK